VVRRHACNAGVVHGGAGENTSDSNRSRSRSYLARPPCRRFAAPRPHCLTLCDLVQRLLPSLSPVHVSQSQLTPDKCRIEAYELIVVESRIATKYGIVRQSAARLSCAHPRRAATRSTRHRHQPVMASRAAVERIGATCSRSLRCENRRSTASASAGRRRLTPALLNLRPRAHAAAHPYLTSRCRPAGTLAYEAGSLRSPLLAPASSTPRSFPVSDVIAAHWHR